MPETESFVPQADEATVVREFYRAVAAHDGAAVECLIRDHFSPRATVVWPESLPYGGALTGSTAIAAAFARAAAASGGGPADLRVVELIGDGPKIAARVAFGWSARADAPVISTEAVELWTFADGSVTEIRAFYWDTHACVTSAPRITGRKS